MKKTGVCLLYLSLMFFIAFAYAGNSYGNGWEFYYSDGEKIPLNVSNDSIAVRFKKGISQKNMRSQIETEKEIEPFSKKEVLNEPEFVLLKVKSGIGADRISQIVDRFITKPDVEFVSRVFDQKGTKMILNKEIIVRFRPSATEKEIDELNSNLGVIVVKKGFLNKSDYILKIPFGVGGDVLRIANTYHDSPIVKFAHPNFIRLLKPQLSPNDQYYNDQWNLNNSGQNGWTVDADIDAPEAWDIHTGDTTVTIAIIDEGVDLNHEDLLANLVTGYDATGNGSGGAPNTWDGHGTSCAGIASAVTDNALGVAGVNWNVKIMPVRIAYSPSSCKGCYWITYDSWIADGIQWAVDNGADVLSNSWGGGSPSSIITSAIQYAKTNGRGGKGSVVAFASGNDDGAIIYPATLSEVIAVGATSPCDERKSPSSCDGEWWWGSNYGPELDVSAPGVKIYTTDIMGSGGYTIDNYVSDFNGTSSATPHVAGLAGLIISADPALSASDVESVIKNTADDLGDPGWDQYFGYGRINAFSALSSLSSTMNSISGTAYFSAFQSGTVNMSAYNRPNTIGSPISSSAISQPGPYTLEQLPDDTYYVFSFVDVDGDGKRDINEAWGYVGYPSLPTGINLSGGVNTTNQDVYLYKPGRVEGSISYSGTDSGQIFINAFLGEYLIQRRDMLNVGNYMLGGLLPGTYRIRVFMDVNGNARYDQGEPRGITFVIVNEGSLSSGVDITLN